MNAAPHVNDQDVDLLLTQCDTGTPYEYMWEWPNDVIAETVRRATVVGPELATYVVARGYADYLVKRDDIPRTTMDAVWAHLLADSFEDYGNPLEWCVTVGLLLQHHKWRASAAGFLAPSFRLMRMPGALGRLKHGEVNAGYAAMAYLITDPAEPLQCRARMLRALDEDLVVSPLTALSLPEAVLRAAYRHRAVRSSIADGLLRHACVLRDAAWCAALIAVVSPLEIAELPLRALEALPAPENLVRTRAIVCDHILASAEATRAFAPHLWWTAPKLVTILARADVLRCVAATNSAEVRAGLLRLLTSVSAHGPAFNTASVSSVQSA